MTVPHSLIDLDANPESIEVEVIEFAVTDEPFDAHLEHSIIEGPATSESPRSESTREQFGLQKWGHIKGRFVYDGKPPVLARINLGGKDVHAAPRPLYDNTLVVNRQNRGVANVVVYVRTRGVPVYDDVEKLKETPIEAVQQNLRISPHVMGVLVGQEVIFQNLDGVAHNINVQPRGDVGVSPLLPSLVSP